MADQQFCLRWNNHQSTLISVFDSLLENGTLVDCTLAAEGQYLKAHKVVLSACSPYLEALLSQHYEKHPIVILKDVKFSELKSMMDYMYRGEVNISQDQLGTFLKAAESLQIKGLTDGNDGDARDVGSTKRPPPPPAPTTQPQKRPEVSPASPADRESAISPSSRKRRRLRRNSHDDVGDNHLDSSNSCDLPAQSTPIVPNIPASVTSTPIVKQEINELSRIESLPDPGPKMEPVSEPLLQPKSEVFEDLNNEDNDVEDLTLDDDDDMDMSQMSNISNMSRPGPSHGADISNQGFAPWQLGGNQSGTDEVFMAAQEAVSAHRDSQGFLSSIPCEVLLNLELTGNENSSPLASEYFNTSESSAVLPLKSVGTSTELQASPKTGTINVLQESLFKDYAQKSKIELDDYMECRFKCLKCGRSYKHEFHLKAHLRECSKVPLFECPQCARKFYHSRNLTRHLLNVHGIQHETSRRKANQKREDGEKAAEGKV